MIKLFKHNEPDYPFHLWLVQFTTFAYLIYRLLSRDYSIYGLIMSESFDYPRFITNLYPPKFTVELLNFHWIYNFIDYPSSELIEIIQLSLIVFSFFGLFGIFNKLVPKICFFGYLHLVGFVQASINEIEGGTICLLALFLLMICNNKSLYALFKKNYWGKSIDNRWPIIVLMLLVGSYYFFAGLNKIIDVHPLWPFTLHLDNLAIYMEEQSIFLANRFSYFPLVPLFKNELFSIIVGFLTIVCELGMGTLIFLPRYRSFFIINMILMHIFVYYSAGINFLGSSFILLLCFDWNCLVRKVKCYYDNDCGFCYKSIKIISYLDIFKKINFIPLQKLKNGELGFDTKRLKDEIGLLEENNEIKYGANAFESIFEKIPSLYIFAILYKIPLVPFVADKIYKYIANNRYLISGSSCKLD